MHETVALSSVRRPMSPDHAAGDENGRLIQAVAICRPDEIFLNFINYCTPQETVNIINEVNDIADRSVVRYLGHGPRVDEVDDISERTVSAEEL